MGSIVHNIECKYCEGRDVCLMRSCMPDSLHEEFRAHRLTKHFDKGEVIYFEGAEPRGLWMLCSGTAKISKTGNDGRTMITRVVNPGDMLGYRALIASDRYRGTAEAMSELIASFVDKSFVEGLLSEHKEVAYMLMVELSRALGVAEDRSIRVAHKDARSRLLETLAELCATRKRVHGSGECTMEFHMKRQDVADLAGLTVETTVRTLKILEKEGMVELGSRTITLRPAGFVESEYRVSDPAARAMQS